MNATISQEQWDAKAPSEVKAMTTRELRMMVIMVGTDTDRQARLTELMKAELKRRAR